MTITLDAIALPPDLVWVDEMAWEPIAQSTQRTLDGNQLVEETALSGGRPITLGTGEQWMPRSTLLALRALAATAGATHTLSLQGVDYSVAFRRPALTARPVFPFSVPEDGDYYAVQINLMTV